MSGRLCRTAEDCFAAGWDDGADDKPLTPDEIERLAVLHSPHLRQQVQEEGLAI